MTKEQFEALRAKQDLTDLFYPDAKDWMWDYCLFLGKFTDSKGKNYDLGVHFNNYTDLEKYNFSLAIVYSNEPGDYSSGYMNYNRFTHDDDNLVTMLEYYKMYGFEHYVETWNRLQKICQNS
jgi:hypothetical protein